MGSHKHNCFSDIFIPNTGNGCPKCGSSLHVDVGDLDDPDNDMIMFCTDCGYDSSDDDD